jgi:hypothetical protein
VFGRAKKSEASLVAAKNAFRSKFKFQKGEEIGRLKLCRKDVEDQFGEKKSLNTFFVVLEGTHLHMYVHRYMNLSTYVYAHLL